LCIRKFFLWEYHYIPKPVQILEIFPLHWFVPKRIVGLWLSLILARNSDVKLEQLFLLNIRFMGFHNYCFCILFWSFRADFAPRCPLSQWSLFMRNRRFSADFGLLLRDITPFRRSLCRILCCTDTTASLADAPVDGDVRKVSHWGGPDDSFDSTSSLFNWYRLQVTNPDVPGSRRE
jgi:hypothetical protein